MRHLLAIVLMVTGLASPARAASAFVAGDCEVSANGVTVTTTAINITGANTVHVFVSENAGGGTAVPSDGVNTFTGSLDTWFVAGGETLHYSYAKNVTTSATYQVSVTGSNPAVCVLAFSGQHTTVPFGGEVGDETGVYGTTIDPGPITPGAADSVVLTAVAFNTATVGGSFSINEGYTLFGQINRDINSIGLGVAYKIQTAAVLTDPRWTTPTTTSMVSSIVWTKDSGAGGGGGGSTPSRMLGGGVF